MIFTLRQVESFLFETSEEISETNFFWRSADRASRYIYLSN